MYTELHGDGRFIQHKNWFTAPGKYRLFVAGPSVSNALNADIMQLFREFGEIKLICRPESRRSCVYVEYADATGFNNALQTHAQSPITLEGTPLDKVETANMYKTPPEGAPPTSNGATNSPAKPAPKTPKKSPVADRSQGRSSLEDTLALSSPPYQQGGCREDEQGMGNSRAMCSTPPPQMMMSPQQMAPLSPQPCHPMQMAIPMAQAQQMQGQIQAMQGMGYVQCGMPVVMMPQGMEQQQPEQQQMMAQMMPQTQEELAMQQMQQQQQQQQTCMTPPQTPPRPMQQTMAVSPVPIYQAECMTPDRNQSQSVVGNNSPQQQSPMMLEQQTPGTPPMAGRCSTPPLGQPCMPVNLTSPLNVGMMPMGVMQGNNTIVFVPTSPTPNFTNSPNCSPNMAAFSPNPNVMSPGSSPPGSSPGPLPSTTPPRESAVQGEDKRAKFDKWCEQRISPTKGPEQGRPDFGRVSPPLALKLSLEDVDDNTQGPPPMMNMHSLWGASKDDQLAKEQLAPSPGFDIDSILSTVAEAQSGRINKIAQGGSAESDSVLSIFGLDRKDTTSTTTRPDATGPVPARLPTPEGVSATTAA